MWAMAINRTTQKNNRHTTAALGPWSAKNPAAWDFRTVLPVARLETKGDWLAGKLKSAMRLSSEAARGSIASELAPAKDGRTITGSSDSEDGLGLTGISSAPTFVVPTRLNIKIQAPQIALRATTWLVLVLSDFTC